MDGEEDPGVFCLPSLYSSTTFTLCRCTTCPYTPSFALPATFRALLAVYILHLPYTGPPTRFLCVRVWNIHCGWELGRPLVLRTSILPDGRWRSGAWTFRYVGITGLLRMLLHTVGLFCVPLQFAIPAGCLRGCCRVARLPVRPLPRWPGAFMLKP